MGTQFGPDPDRAIAVCHAGAHQHFPEARIALPAIAGQSFYGFGNLMLGNTPCTEFARQIFLRMLTPYE